MSKLPAPCSPIRFVFRFIAALSMLFIGVANAAPPSFSAVFSPAVVGPGNESTLIFTVTNDPVQGIRDGQFSNTLPGDLKFATPVNVTSDCTNISVSAANDGTVLSVSGIEMLADSSCSVSMRVKTGAATTYTNVSGDFTSDAGSSGTATAELTVDTTMPVYSLSFVPTAISQGAVSTLTLNIDNFTKTSFSDSWFGTINLSDGLTVAVIPNATTDCLNTTITAISGGNSIGLSGFVIYPASPCSIDVDIHASGLGELNASMSSLSWGSFGDIGQGSALLSVSTAFANFVFDPFVVAPGSTTSLNVTMTNRDRVSSLTNIAFSDDLNAVLTGLVASGLPVSDICGTGSSISGTSTISFSGGNLAPEASCTFSVLVTVPVATAPGTYTNNSSSFTMDKDGTPVTEDPVFNALQVSAAPTLAMDFADADGIVAAGSTTTINYTVTNTDTGNAASDIAFTHNLGTTFDGVTIPVLPAAGFCGAGSTAVATLVLDAFVLNVAGASLAAGASCNFSADIALASGTPGGDYTSTTGSINAIISNTNVGGPGVSDSITVVEGPALTLGLPPIAAAPGDLVTATFTLSKDSLAPSISGVGFSLNLGAALADLSVSTLPLGEVCGAGSAVTLGIDGVNEVISLTGGILDVSDTCSFDVELLVPVTAESGSYSLITSDVTSTVLGVLVIGSPAVTDLDVTNLTATMSFIDDPVAPGGVATLRFSFQNTSSTQDLTNMFFTMNLNAVVTGLVATGLPANDVCGTGSAITGTGSLIFTGGNLLSSTSCTFDVTVSVPGGAAVNIYNAVTGNLTFTENATTKTVSPLTDELTVEIDEAPDVDITSTFSPVTNVSSIPVSITFTEDVTGFDVTDIIVTNGNLSGFAPDPGSARVYSVNVAPIADGTVTLQIPAGSAVDSGSNPNIGSSFSIEFDSGGSGLPPTVTIGAPDQTTTSAGPVNYAITYFNADTIILDATAVNLVSTGDADALISVADGTSSTPTVTLSSITGNGTLAISLDEGTARNSAGVAGAITSTAFKVENAPANDDDADGVENGSDLCPSTAPGAAVDANGCSSAQRLEIACPVDGDYKNHGQYVSCVAHEVNAQVDIGLITEEEGDAIVSAAAQSDIGKKMKAASFEASTLILLLMLALARRVRLNRKY